MTTKEILDKYKTIAVYGMSTSTNKPARRVPAFLYSKGFEIIPINPKADKIIGKKVYRELKDIPDKIEILDVFRPSSEAYGVVKEAVERHKEKGDIDVIWLQDGIVSDEGKKLAEENGIEFVQDKCMHTEYVSNFGS